MNSKPLVITMKHSQDIYKLPHFPQTIMNQKENKREQNLGLKLREQSGLDPIWEMIS